MDTVILIPARYASTRYPGKPLADADRPRWHQDTDPAKLGGGHGGARGRCGLRGHR